MKTDDIDRILAAWEYVYTAERERRAREDRAVIIALCFCSIFLSILILLSIR